MRSRLLGWRALVAALATWSIGCSTRDPISERAHPPPAATAGSAAATAADAVPARAKLKGEPEAARPMVLATLGAATRAHRGTLWDGCLLGHDTFLTTGADATIRIWDVPSGAPRGVLPLKSSGSEIACARDGSRFAVAHDPVVELRDGASGKVERTLRLEGFTRALELAPNGRDLARVDDKCRTSVIGASGEVRVFAPSDASPGALGAVGWDASGETLASSCGPVEIDRGIDLFSVAGAGPSRHFDRPDSRRGHVGSLAFFGGSLAFTTDELYLVDPKELAIREKVRLGPERALTLFFEASPDGKRLALFHRDHLEIRDTPGGAAVAKLDGHIDEVHWVDDRHLAVSYDHELRWFELGAQSLIEQGAIASLRGEVRALAVSADRRWLAAGDDAGQLVVFDLTSGAPPRRLRDEKGSARELRFTAEGALLAAFEASILRFEPGTFARTHTIARWGNDAFEDRGVLGAIGQHEIDLFDKDGPPKVTDRKGELAAASVDGAWLVEIDTTRHRAALVERKTNKTRRTFDIGQGQASCLLSTDQSLLACRGTSGYLWTRAFDVGTGKTLLSSDESRVEELLDLSTAPRRLVFNDAKRGLCADALDGSPAKCIGEDVLPSVRAARVIQYQGAPALAVGGSAGVVEIVPL